MLLCVVFLMLWSVSVVWFGFIHANYKLTSSVLIFNVVCFVLFYRCVVFHPLASTTTKSSRFRGCPQTLFKVNIMIYFLTLFENF